MIIIDNCKLAEAKNRDMATWLTYHHCQVKIDERGGGMAVMIPLVCQHLDFNPETGLASCLNYDNRPQICRDYLCEGADKAKE